jgi:integrase
MQKVVTKVKEWEQERDADKVRAAGRTWTVESWLTHWFKNIAAPTVRPNTLTGYRVAVYNHLIPGIGAHRIDKLRPEHLERLCATLGTKRTRTGSKLKAATIHQVHRTVQTALGEAVRRHHITESGERRKGTENRR